jgi:hypothetical protein
VTSYLGSPARTPPKISLTELFRTAHFFAPYRMRCDVILNINTRIVLDVNTDVYMDNNKCDAININMCFGRNMCAILYTSILMRVVFTHAIP